MPRFKASSARSRRISPPHHANEAPHALRLRHGADERGKPFAAADGRTLRWGDSLSPDTASLKSLFSAEEPLFDVIVGHSKGNLSIAEALHEAQSAAPASARALLRHAHIITVSAAIYMPDESRRVTDIIGAADWFAA
jgi:hypothetical protein